MVSEHARRRLLQKGVGFALLVTLVGWIGWSGGRNVAPNVPREYRVTGPSMMPTLKGPHRMFVCPNCRVRFAAAARVESDRESFPCWHCGQEIWAANAPAVPGDIVKIEPISSGRASFEIGQLVAIDWNDRRQVKRVLALPGDTVDVDSDRRLLVNGRRLEDRLADRGFETRPTAPVDFDALRDLSRWRPTDDQAWQRVDRRWRAIRSKQPGWLVYRHQAVYDQNRAAPIYDDHPQNVDVIRQLKPAERLWLRFRLEPDDAIEKIQVAFWTVKGHILVERSVSSGSQSTPDPNMPIDMDMVVHQREGARAGDLPVARTAPVAIRILGGAATLNELSVGRDLEYRLNDADPAEPYPMRLSAGECYLVGDNVPVSIDSRSLGAAPLNGVIGMISARTGGRE